MLTNLAFIYATWFMLILLICNYGKYFWTEVTFLFLAVITYSSTVYTVAGAVLCCPNLDSGTLVKLQNLKFWLMIL